MLGNSLIREFVDGWQYEKLALQSLPIYHSSLIANFLYCVLSAAFYQSNY